MLLISTFVFLRIVSNSFSSLFQKKLSQAFGSILINVVSYFILSVFCLIFFKLFSFENKCVFLYALIVGLFGAIGNSFQIKALNLGELSVLAPINSYKIVFSLLFSFLILKEIPDIISFLGMFLIIAGSYFIFETTKEGFSFSLFLRKDIQYRILAVLFTSFEAVYIKKMIIVSNSMTALFLWSFLSFIFSFLFLVFQKNKFHKIKVDFMKFFLLLSLTMGVMQYCTNVLFLKMNVSYALCLFQLSSLLSVFLGYKFFKEKELSKKIIGSFIMIIGAVLIILQDK